MDAITSAKLTESQSATLRARALEGEDITDAIAHEQKVLAEALALVSHENDDDEGGRQRVGEYLGGGGSNGDWDVTVPGFGKAV